MFFLSGSSNLVENDSRDKRGVQSHDWDHSAGQEAHHQVQPQGAHWQAAHLLGVGSVLCNGSLHPQKEAVPFLIDQKLRRIPPEFRCISLHSWPTFAVNPTLLCSYICHTKENNALNVNLWFNDQLDCNVFMRHYFQVSVLVLKLS